MTRLSVVLCLAVLPLAATAAAETLDVQISDVRATTGNVMIAIVAGADGFADKTPPVASLILPARGNTVAFTTNALPAGEYAIRVMHDVNGNGELDANFVGMPTEPYGFSNDASGSFGPPKWEAARFSIGADGAVQRIKLNH